MIIVGAGLTGLRAALDLRKAGLAVLVVEQREHVGGRIATSIEDGCKLDHGFQVILRAYPELTLIDGVDSLGLKPFRSGARVRWQGRFYDVVDPREQPSALLSLLNHPFASLRDLVRLACLATFYRDTEVSSDVRSTSELLDRHRFSPPFRNAFLEPFLRGVLLDPKLSMDSAMTRFYLKVFSEGPACLPRDGMQALPELLLGNLGSSHVRLSSSVAGVTECEVILANGETLRAQRVLCALDCLGAAQLGGPEQTLPMHAVGVLYFTSAEPPYAEPLLVLNGEGDGPINNLAVLTNVQGTYAPAGTSLISVTVLGAKPHQEPELWAQVEAQARAWYGDSVTTWRRLRSFWVDAAIPARPRLGKGWLEHNGVFFAGDYLSYGSQNGALRAGRKVAEAILTEL